MIYLYENVTPNRGQNTHYVFSNLTNYVTAIETASTNTTSFAEDSYRINSGVCMVYYNAANKPALRLHNITYLGHVFTDEGNNTVTTFYHVTRAEMEAGYLRLYLTRDDWATNYIQAKKSNLFVERCSKALGLAGTYPDAQHLTSESITTMGDFDNSFIPNSASLSVVYRVVFSYQTASYVRLLANPLNRLCSQNSNDNLTFSRITNLLGGIFKETGTGRDAVVTNAWIVPTAALNGSDATQIPMILETATNIMPDQSDKYIYSKLLLNPNIYAYTRDYSVNDRTPENIHYIGTEYKRVKLPRVNADGSCLIKWIFITDKDELQVLLQVGDNFTDFTDQFEISLTTSNGGVTATERTRRTIQTVGSLISGAIGVASMLGGNPFGLIAAISGLGTTAASATVRPSAGMPSSSGGDAATVLYAGVGTPDSLTYYKNPFKLITYSTDEAIDKKSAYMGVEYSTYYITSNPDPLFTIAGLSGVSIDSNGNEIISPQGYFIKGQICFSGIQSDAAQFMENEIAGGIYVKKV